MISAHFEFSMYLLGASFCQQIKKHRIRRMVFSVIEFYDDEVWCSIFQVGSGEVFSFDEPITNDDEYEEDDDWQDLVNT